MKFILTILASLATSGLWAAGTNDLTTPLQRGLLEEEANHQLEAAIGDYKEAIDQFDHERQLAATAIFRLGECYRKLGRTNEAAIQYQRIAREFDDQKELVALSRQNLSGMGASVALAGTSIPDAARKKQQQLVEDEIKVVERELALQQTQFKNGLLTEDATLATQQKLLELKRQSAALDEGQAISPATFAGAAVEGPVLPLEEEKFLREVKESVQNSPDLLNQQLRIAADKGYVRAAEFLLAHGADAGKPRPMIAAAITGNEAMVELLLSHGAAVNNQDGDGGTALTYAARNGFMTVCKTLVEHGADVNKKDKNGATPLRAAVDTGQLSVAQFLLTNKAQMNLRTISDGMTPLAVCIRQSNVEMARLLLENHADANMETEPPNGPTTPLRWAIQENTPIVAQMVQLLLEHGANPNAADGNGEPILVYATRQGNADVIRSLIAHGADVNASDKQGFTPLHWAAEKKDPSLAEILVKNNAQVDAKTGEGYTPLTLAIFDDAREEVVKLLLDNHADANMETGPANNRHIQLLWAIQGNHTETVQLLVEHGTKPNAVESDGDTPLAGAIRHFNVDMVRALLDHGADVNFPDKQGRPPLAQLRTALADTSVHLPGQPPPRLPFGPRAPIQEMGPQIEALLLKAGADPDYDRRRAIWTYGDDGTPKYEIIQCPSNSINHSTLLEFLAALYDVYAPRDWLSSKLITVNNNGRYAHGDALVQFPEFARVTIHRLEGKKDEVLHVNVAEILHSGNGSKDVALQAGDLVEIGRQEHKVADTWYGLSAEDVTAFNKCLLRKVKIISQIHTNEFALLPSFADAASAEQMNIHVPQAPLNNLYPGQAEILKDTKADAVVRSFFLAGVVRDAKVLLNTWDLSRVQLERGGAKMTFDLTANPTPYVWLKDGDVIEIPELGESAPVTEAK